MLALLDKGSYPIGFDIFLVLKPEFVLNPYLYRQAVHVIPGPVNDIQPLHPLIAQDAVFEDLIPGSTQVNMSGGIGWPVHEEPGLIPGIMFLHPAVDLIFGPE